MCHSKQSESTAPGMEQLNQFIHNMLVPLVIISACGCSCHEQGDKLKLYTSLPPPVTCSSSSHPV